MAGQEKMTGRERSTQRFEHFGSSLPILPSIIHRMASVKGSRQLPLNICAPPVCYSKEPAPKRPSNQPVPCPGKAYPKAEKES